MKRSAPAGWGKGRKSYIERSSASLYPEEPHIFLPVLVYRAIYCAKGSAPNLLLDKVLVDAMLGDAVIFAVAVLGSRIEGFLPVVVRLPHMSLTSKLTDLDRRSSRRRYSSVVTQRAVIGRQ